MSAGLPVYTVAAAKMRQNKNLVFSSILPEAKKLQEAASSNDSCLYLRLQRHRSQ
jgi:hypothetical protein